MVFIFLFICCCLVMMSIIAIIAFYLIEEDKGEGTSCNGDDKNANFEYDDEGDCVSKGCKIGYNIGEDGNCVILEEGGDGDGDGDGDASGGGGGGGEIEDGNYRIIFPGINGGLNYHNGYAIARRDTTADIWKITHIDGTNYTIQRPDNQYLIYPADTTKGQYAWCCHQYDVPPDNAIFNIQKIDDDNTYNFKSKDGNQIFGNTSPDNENYGGTLYGSVETDPASVYDRWEPNFKIEPA
jgi:hypothetical protein